MHNTVLKSLSALQAILDISHNELECDFPVSGILGGIAAVLFLSLVLLVVTYKFRGELQIILYMKLHWSPFDKTDDNIWGKVSIGYVSGLFP